MFKKISFKLSIKLMVVLLVFIAIYHLMILFGFIPYDAVWGGRLQSRSQMYRYETIALIVTLFMIVVISIKGGYIIVKFPELVMSILLWTFTVYFIISIAGNLFSTNCWEAIIFTPISVLSTFLCLRLAIEK